MTGQKAEIFIVINTLLTILSPGFWGMLGGSAYYIYQTTLNPKDFEWKMFWMYCFLGFVMGIIAHDISMYLFDNSWPGLMTAAGFSVKRMAEISNYWVDKIVKK